jgi:hypothetical protein
MLVDPAPGLDTVTLRCNSLFIPGDAVMFLGCSTLVFAWTGNPS